VAALAGKPEHLLEATREWLHQEQREPAMPSSLAMVHQLRAAGVPAVISGAGPTVLAFVGADADRVLASTPEGWQAHHLAIDPRGAYVL
jgi:homoserine kinase